MLPEKLRGGRLALDLCRGAVPNLLRCSAAVYVDQVGVGPGSQQGVHAPQHLDQSVGVPVRACSARAHLPFTQADGTSMVEGVQEQRGVLDLSGPRGAKRVSKPGGGLHGGAPANLHAFTSGKITHLYRDDTKQHGLIWRNLKQRYSFI